MRSLFLAGERCDVETLDWAKKSFGVPVLDHWWQTGEKVNFLFPTFLTDTNQTMEIWIYDEL